MFVEIEFDAPKDYGVDCRRFRAPRMLLDVCHSKSGLLEEFEFCYVHEQMCYVLTWSRTAGHHQYQVDSRNAIIGMTLPRLLLKKEQWPVVDLRGRFVGMASEMDASIEIAVAARLPKSFQPQVELARCG